MKKEIITPTSIGQFLESMPDPRIQAVEKVEGEEPDDRILSYLIRFEVDHSTYNILLFYFPNDGTINVLEQLTRLDTVYLNSLAYKKVTKLWKWWEENFPDSNFALAKDDGGRLTIATEQSAAKYSLYDLEGLVSELMNQTPPLVNKIKNLASY